MEELREFERYLGHLGEGLSHADRKAGLRGYCTGLMAPLKRKSVEPMASHLAPTATRSRHQSLHHFVSESAWSDEEMLLRVAQWVVPAMDFGDGGWWVIDDTGFPKQGTHSVVFHGAAHPTPRHEAGMVVCGRWRVVVRWIGALLTRSASPWCREPVQ